MIKAWIILGILTIMIKLFGMSTRSSKIHLLLWNRMTQVWWPMKLLDLNKIGQCITVRFNRLKNKFVNNYQKIRYIENFHYLFRLHRRTNVSVLPEFDPISDRARREHISSTAKWWSTTRFVGKTRKRFLSFKFKGKGNIISFWCQEKSSFRT